MSDAFYSVFDLVQEKILSGIQNEYLAEISASIDSTLESIWKDEGRFHRYSVLVLDQRLSKIQLTRLSILSWFVSKNLGYLLREEISKRTSSNIDLVEINLMLKSKSQMLVVLSELLAPMNKHQIFGNFLNEREWSTLVSRKNIRLKSRRNYILENEPKFHKRTIGVGYRDKGNLAEMSSGNPNRFLDLTKEQNRIEKNRNSFASIQLLLEGFLI